MAGRKVSGPYAVYVTQDDGQTKVYLPGEEVPAAQAEGITNPKVWGASTPAQSEDMAVEKPAGNASTETWAEYAAAQGKDVEGLSRDEIRDLFA